MADLVGFIGVAAVGVALLRARKAAPAPFGGVKREEDSVFIDPNNPRDAEGHVHHLHVKQGEVANRILSVGDMGRADRIAHQLDFYGTASPSAPIRIVAPRGFVTYTGTFKGVPVTILATGMGVPMMDFAVRESRACVEGPMAMLRYGTCGGLRDTKAGTVVVSEGTILVRRDGDLIAAQLELQEAKELSAGGKGAGEMPTADDSADIFPYLVSNIVRPDPTLTALILHGCVVHTCTLQFKSNLETELKTAKGDKHAVVAGINASADSFYSSQGRITENFHDFNGKVISNLEARPELAELRCLEMETHHLLDLARCSTKKAKIYAAGAAMVIANRHTLEGIDKQTLCELEEIGGRAGLEALIAFRIPAA